MVLLYPNTIPDIGIHFAWILSYYRKPWMLPASVAVIQSWMNNIGYALTYFGKDTGFVDRQSTPIRVGDILGLKADPFSSESARNPMWFAGYDITLETYAPQACFEIDLQPARSPAYYQYAPLLPTDFSFMEVIGDLVTTPEKFHMIYALTDKELIRLKIEEPKRAIAKAIRDAALVKERLKNDPLDGWDPQYIGDI
jgi:hypothetical protein